MKDRLTGEDEDLIFRQKTFIEELSKVQSLYFDSLCAELELNDYGNEHLFDYIFNDYDGIGFDEYLGRYGVNEEDIFEENE